MARNQNAAPPAGASAPQGTRPQETAEQKAAREATEAQARADAEAAGNVEAIVILLRHKTPHAVYRRAGVVIGKVAAEYSVTAEQLAALEADSWVEVVRK